MATTRWGQVVDALLERLRARTGLTDPEDRAAGATAVYDGPQVALVAEQGEDYLVVGWSGDPDDPEAAGDSGQATASSGTPRSRDETGTVQLLAVAQSGDADPDGSTVAAVRARALALVGHVEAELRAAPDLGVASAYMEARVGGASSIRQFVQGGAVCWIEFQVTYRTRI